MVQLPMLRSKSAVRGGGGGETRAELRWPQILSPRGGGGARPPPRPAKNCDGLKVFPRAVRRRRASIGASEFHKLDTGNRALVRAERRCRSVISLTKLAPGGCPMNDGTLGQPYIMA
jgi:hypothetical protein